jgi:hypothetical protein
LILANEAASSYLTYTGRGDTHACQVVIDEDTLYENEGQYGFDFEAIKSRIPEIVRGEATAGLNQDFEHGLLQPFGGSLASLIRKENLALLSGVEHPMPPIYPNCDILGCLCFGHVGRSSCGFTERQLQEAARRELLEESGILFPVECFKCNTLPVNLPRRIDYDNGQYHDATKLTFFIILVPVGSHFGEEEVINDSFTEFKIDQKRFRGRRFRRLCFPVQQQ